MGDFFHGWRRKVGVVTLVMALIAMVGWVRSLMFYDVITMFSVCGRLQTVDSLSGELYFISWKDRPFDQFEWDTMYNSFPAHPFPVWPFCTPTCVNSGFVYRGRGVIIPYGIIVLSLTTISAYLLLTKPCQSNQKKHTEPKANEGV